MQSAENAELSPVCCVIRNTSRQRTVWGSGNVSSCSADYEKEKL